MAAGWGKKAVGKLNKLQSDCGRDELLQSLSGQYNVDFSPNDYEQWGRKGKDAKVDKTKPVEAGTGRKTFANLTKETSASTCHSKIKREKKEAIKREEMEKIRNERLKVIELRLKTRRKTLEEYTKREQELLAENMRLQDEIMSVETGTHGEVKGLLRKYEQFRSGISNLHNLFTVNKSEATNELDKTQGHVNKEIVSLEARVAKYDQELTERLRELNVLKSYKDKEYPVKAMKVADLQKEIADLKVNYQEDQEELEHIIKTELEKFQRERNANTEGMTERITEQAISMMHPSLRDMALQNIVMKREIAFHRNEQDELQRVNHELDTEIGQLLRNPQTNTKSQMFPEFYPPHGKCTPDMDVMLDIPTHQLLPI